MKILVLFTGGTIGSTVKDGWISTDKSTKYTLIENYKNKFGNDTTFVVKEPYYTLSENLSADKLNLLINAINENLKEDFDAIIVTHGTDSLHFSAAAIYHCFCKAALPIVFVSANYPLDDSRSNGNDNFEGAVALIKSGVKSGVYISYRNPDKNHYIHIAKKALAFNETDDSIYSLNQKPFAEYKNGKIEILDEYKFSASVSQPFFCENPKILVITVMPGDNFAYNLSEYNAVILRPYHSGTLNTENDCFKVFLAAAKKIDIPVFLANAPFGTTYETAKQYDEIGIISLSNTTFAYVYMRLWLGISKGENLKNLF